MTYKSIDYDFGEGFVFGDEMSMEGIDYLSYTTGKSSEFEEYNGCNVTVYTNGTYPQVIRLSKDIPIFDSGDREYDSWHDLYLVSESNGQICAVYCTGGYRLARIIGFSDVIEYPEEFELYLKKNELHIGNNDPKRPVRSPVIYDYGAMVKRFIDKPSNLPRPNGLDKLKPKYLAKARKHYNIPENEKFLYTYKADAFDSLSIYPHQRFYFTDAGIYANRHISGNAVLPSRISWKEFSDARLEKAPGLKNIYGTMLSVNGNNMILKWTPFPTPSAAKSWWDFYINLQKHLKENPMPQTNGDNETTNERSFDMKKDIYTEHEKENHEYVGKLINLLLEYLANGTIPETGRFNGACGRFGIVGSEYYLAYAGVVHDSEDSSKRDIKVGVTNAKAGYDIFEFDFNGTSAEMLEYLKSDALADIWYEKFIKMARRWDEKSGKYPF